MRTRKMMLGAVILGVLAVFGLSLALAQEGSRRGRSRWTPEQIRQRSMERIKEALAPSEDEWKVLEPKLNKVLTLAREAGVSSMRRTRRRRGSDTDPAAGEQSDVAKATQGLVKILENKEAKPEEIKAKLKALRDARKKAMEALAKARKPVGETAKLRQEAQLVLMGVID